MDTADFLARVLDSNGYYAVITISERAGPRQVMQDSVGKAAQLITALNERGANVYYGISTFATPENRKQKNVLRTKVLALDIDVGKENNSYDTLAEAGKGLQDFLNASALPMPMVVFSGNGLHVYWVLTRGLAPFEWQPLANALKTKAVQLGLCIDPAVPADSARVLRPVGTKHPNGKMVKLLRDTVDVSPEDMAAALGVTVAAKPAPKTNLLNNLAVTQDFPTADANVIASKCAQVKWAIANQKDVDEPFWYSLMGIAAYTHNPGDAAVAWSEQHPGYSEAATLKKLEQWKASTTGPATCVRLEGARPGGCKGCVFKGKIVTPVHLGVQRQEAPEIAPEKAPAEITIMPVPKPFKRTTHGIFMTMDGTDIPVCDFDLYPVSYGYDEHHGCERVKFMWERKHVGWRPLELDNKHLMQGSQKFGEVCGDQGIPANFRPSMERFQHMLRSYIDALRAQRSTTDNYAAMGWKEDFTKFSLGNRIIRKDENGEIVEEPLAVAGSLSELAPYYIPRGSFEEQVKLTGILGKAKLHEHAYVLGASLASVLYPFSGINGCVISLCGLTGVGKSLAQEWAQSLWGDPAKLHATANTTPNAIYDTLGTLNNLPFTMDEVTLKSDKELGDFGFTVAQGLDKARLNKTGEQRKRKRWATVAITSSNISLASKRASQGNDNEAQAMRVLEIHIKQNELFRKSTAFGKTVRRAFSDNCGWIGPAFVARLVEMGPDAVRKMVEESIATFARRYNTEFSGEERFWENNVALAELALRKAREWELSEIDEALAVGSVLSALKDVRVQSAAERNDYIDYLSTYLNEFGDEILRVVTIGQGRPQPVLDSNRLPVSIRAEFRLQRPTPNSKFSGGVLHVVRTPFKQWLAKQNVEWKEFVDYLKDHGLDCTGPDNRYSIGQDTGHGVGQVRVISLDLANSPRLRYMMNATDEVAPTLTVVQGDKK